MFFVVIFIVIGELQSRNIYSCRNTKFQFTAVPTLYRKYQFKSFTFMYPILVTFLLPYLIPILLVVRVDAFYTSILSDISSQVILVKISVILLYYNRLSSL